MDIDEGAWPAYLDEGMPPLYGVASPYSCGEFEAQMQLPPPASSQSGAIAARSLPSFQRAAGWCSSLLCDWSLRDWHTGVAGFIEDGFADMQHGMLHVHEAPDSISSDEVVPLHITSEVPPSYSWMPGTPQDPAHRQQPLYGAVHYSEELFDSSSAPAVELSPPTGLDAIAWDNEVIARRAPVHDAHSHVHMHAHAHNSSGAALANR